MHYFECHYRPYSIIRSTLNRSIHLGHIDHLIKTFYYHKLHNGILAIVLVYITAIIMVRGAILNNKINHHTHHHYHLRFHIETNI
ncbi:hypothetical protein [Pelistega europaea]|uniref:hypothetical protein n=1 Tax=Pelistega europaea TaxID=106147 RepID=UPI001490EAFA|nr:hypothetical protein [Pelistega europaea]